MKKLVIFALLISAFVSCSKNEEDILPVSNNEEVVTLTFSPYTMEAITRSASAISDFADRLDIWIVQGENTTTYHQVKTDNGFGSLTLALDRNKSYTLYAIASKFSEAVTLENGIFTFPDPNITDCFYYTTTFTPTKSSISCTMNRVIAKFSIWMTDEIPATVKKFVISISESGTKLTTSGTAAEIATRTREFTSWSSVASGTIFNVQVIPTSMTDKVKMTFTVTAYDANDQVVTAVTFEDVDIKVDYKSTYKGDFFSANSGFTFLGTPINEYEIVEF